MIKLRTIFILLIVHYGVFVNGESQSSYDSLISSQCKARCVSLYPWKNVPHIADRKHIRQRSLPVIYHPFNPNEQERTGNESSVNSLKKRFTNPLSDHSGGMKWQKVMDLCTKNTNCLQCSLPCEIPTNLLANCKYLCKNQHPLCMESCDLLSKLNEHKYGSCPSAPVLEYKLLSDTVESTNKCSNISLNLINPSDSTDASSTETECTHDSDCGDVRKCCLIDSQCPQLGRSCQKPIIAGGVNLPSIPVNLTISERKKGKTVVLNWDSTYAKNKPTLFVVEGRWSLKQPTDGSSSQMTKWGYLAQTVNSNWIVLRNLNRGRWYKFRVAAVSKQGTHGFSESTASFILSSAPKPPSQPENLTVTNVYASSSEPDRVDADITWIPSKRSDLPVLFYKLTWKIEHHIDETGYELIDAQNLNKFTLKGLLKESVYTLELTAISKYETNMLTSNKARAVLNTGLMSGSAVDPHRLVDQGENLDDYDEDEDLDDSNEPPSKSQPSIMTRNSNNPQQPPPQQSPMSGGEKMPPKIKNLTIQTAYFQNGLVKARSSWYLEQQTENEQPAAAASINAKTVFNQPMYTLTWFPIKCVEYDEASQKYATLSPKQLPTPITATTINTHFEIYELKFNCDYVVNVRLANTNNNRLNPAASSSSLLGASVPQIASAQFRVPPCGSIEIVGRINPVCYDYGVPSLDLTSSTSTLTSTSSSTTTASTTTTTTLNPLPKIINIRYKIVDRVGSRVGHHHYAVEFYWSLPFSFNRNLLNGYQISVVPKEIPGIEQQDQQTVDSLNSGGGYFGSVGAIIGRDQHSFVVRQLSPSVRYIFQIQAIGLDGQTYGPTNSLEFIINERFHATSAYRSDNEPSSLSDLFKTTSSSPTASPSSSSDYFYFNNSNRLSDTRRFLFLPLIVSVFTMFVSFWCQ